MRGAIWTLLCKDQHTPPYTKVYPPWYANPLARSMARYDVTLKVLTDQPKEVFDAAQEAKIPNMEVYPIEPRHYAGLRFKPLGWWNKLLFYNPVEFPNPIIFIDLDSIFAKDPIAIFRFILKEPFPLIMERAVFSWFKPRPTVASPLVYIDPHQGLSSRIWGIFAREAAIPVRDGERYKPVLMRGDQDFIEYALQQIFGKSHEERDEAVGRWPINFYGRYKVITEAVGWAHQSRLYKGLRMNDFVSLGFNGWPKIEDIINGKLAGHSFLSALVNKEELEGVGFVDPNQRGKAMG